MSERREIVRAMLETLTHARLRARQGDLDGARELLHAILERSPTDEGARGLLGQLDRMPQRVPEREAEPPQEDRPLAGEPGRLARRFRGELGSEPPLQQRIRRLEVWLERIAGPRATAR